MKFSSVPSLLRAFAALPAAGATAALNMRVLDCDEITIYILYQCDAAVANGAPTLRNVWTFRATTWDPTGGVAEGTKIVAGVLDVEDWAFVTPGAAGANWVRKVSIAVPAGAEFFSGTIRETGTPATPGNAAVMGVTSQ